MCELKCIIIAGKFYCKKTRLKCKYGYFDMTKLKKERIQCT